ncbi:MAG: RagB/SusD family nutrient uptake outer membrane protein [Tannerella sp.]|nr:RagB/SusD family nutrient uptake outer membrane protein [Tannerella sp.]
MKQSKDKKKRTRLLAASLLVNLCFFTGFLSCADMLETDTDHYKTTEGHVLNSPNDTIYSMVGILQKMQAIADRYVLVGELRGDLLDVTENADLELQAISNFNVKETDKNPYTDTRAYYDIINNCNFFIQRADTTATVSGRSVMIKELAAVKTIRAWVYMQLLLNYGKACYYNNPILTVEDRDKIKNDPSVWISDLNTLLNRLKEPLTEAQEIQRTLGNPSYNGMHDFINVAFIPATLVLGDLYLYTGQAELAAVQYHDYLYSHRLNLLWRRQWWGDAGFSSFISATSSNESITAIYTSTENESGSQLMGWCLPAEWTNRLNVNCTYQLRPSIASMNLWNRQEYAFLPREATPLDEPTYTTGDLRGTVRSGTTGLVISYTASDMPPFFAGNRTISYSNFVTAESDSLPFIQMYGEREGDNYYNLSYIYRIASVYLRYIEALNRLNKPTLAFAVLKYGVSNALFNDPAKVNSEEVNPLPPYCNFPETIFPATATATRGIHSRGCGESDRNRFYVIPADCDTVRFVDEKICDEMALETACEGNRFHDLMRFANYYGNEFLATRVANRRGVEDAALKAKLMNEQNWFLPHN